MTEHSTGGAFPTWYFAEGTTRTDFDEFILLSNPNAADVPATLHYEKTDGTVPQLRRAMDRSLDAFFDLLPGADEEDVEKFGE